MQTRGPAPSPAPPARGWALATVLTVLVAALLLLVGDARYFFHGDTQAAYLGWEYRLGEQVRNGHWPLLDPSAWGAGNPVAEGQWGLFSPLVIALGLVATVSSNVLVFATTVKIALVCAGSLGAFVLARSYGAAAPLAFVASVAVTQGGMTQYLDLPSWLAGLMIWSLLPWVWWALRRTMFGPAGPFLPLVLGYLLVTVGYVYGTIMLIVVLGACLVDAWAAGSRSAAWKVLGVGGICGLVALTVYLPGVLTVPVTARATGFAMAGKLASDPLALFTSVLPTATVPGTTEHLLPYAYTLWFLPVLVWLDLARLRRGWRPVAGLLLVTVVMVLVVVAGPAKIGPLHWPLRLQPFLVQFLGVGCAVLVSRYVVRRPSALRLSVSVAWVVLAAVAASLRAHGGWTGNLVSLLLVTAGICAVWWALTHRARGRVATSAALGAAALTVGLAVVQHGFFSVPALARAAHAGAGAGLPPAPRDGPRGRDGGGRHLHGAAVGPRDGARRPDRVGVVPRWARGREHVHHDQLQGLQGALLHEVRRVDLPRAPRPAVQHRAAHRPHARRPARDEHSRARARGLPPSLPGDRSGRLAGDRHHAPHRHLATHQAGARRRAAGVDLAGHGGGAGLGRRPVGAVRGAAGAARRRAGRAQRPRLARVPHGRRTARRPGRRLPAPGRPPGRRPRPDGRRAVLPAGVAGGGGGVVARGRRRAGLVRAGPGEAAPRAVAQEAGRPRRRR